MVTGDAVVVSSTGQLGIVVSSARYKRDIRDMGAASSKLLKLRPVSFRYNQDPSNTVQYGLVAEEVAKSYPELVSSGDDGRPQTVRYLELSAMLLNELQKQARENQRQAAQLTGQAQQLAALTGVVAAQRKDLQEQRSMFEQRLSALEQTIAAKHQTAKLAAIYIK